MKKTFFSSTIYARNQERIIYNKDFVNITVVFEVTNWFKLKNTKNSLE